MKTKSLLLATLASVLLVGTLWAPPNEQQPYQGSAELERIKALAGDWKGKIDHGEGPVEITVAYKVVAGGSAVQERVFADTPMEMVTMYHDRNGTLALTHYCMLHNQPAMILASADEQSVRFDFDERCGIDPASESHMHAMTLTFNEDGTITHDWTHFEGGEAKARRPFTLTRVE